jgi:hypothetical protein
LALSLGHDFGQPPVEVVDQLGDAGLLGHDRPNALPDLGELLGLAK